MKFKEKFEHHYSNGFKFCYEATLKDGKKEMRACKNLNHILENLSNREWRFCDLWYGYIDNFGKFAFAQIVGYTPRNLPQSEKPTHSEIARYVTQLQSGGREIKHLTYLGICHYVEHELDGDIYSVGLDPLKYSDWQNIENYQNITTEARMLLQDSGNIDDGIRKAIERLELSPDLFEGAKNYYLKTEVREKLKVL